ncbi:hypothetical protein HHL01_04010 [Pseudoalteromonas arctica]|uniref:Uncharacterized protein n=1 Tax=Pseudoalteromonas arctica TaxID=394751 RepID=A0A7X9YF05_9GAMM|nr:hypothetical protein [Pseudoalteromonas arctica]NMF47354.1 hypothetical protein [Pseudoalteromonas arctica]
MIKNKPASNAIKELANKIEMSKWGGPNSLFADEINNGFRSALKLFGECGDYTLFNNLLNAFDDKYRQVIVKYITDCLPLKYSSLKNGFIIDKTKSKWSECVPQMDATDFSPIKDISLSKNASSGVISVDRTKMELPELHSFMLDALVLFRNEFNEMQIDELFQTITKVRAKRID